MGSVYDRGGARGGSVYDRGSSGGSSVYDRSGRSGGHPSTGPHHSVHGIGGFFHNLAHGAEAAARGFGPGLATAGKDLGLTFWDQKKGNAALRKDIYAPVGHQYAKMYGPLFHGHPGKFAQNVYNDPFGPILDALTLATAGTGVVARAGGALAKAGAISDESYLARMGKSVPLKVPTPQARAGQGGEWLTLKDSHANAFIRGRQRAVNAGLNKLPPGTPAIGSDARYARTIARTASRRGMTLGVKGHPFTEAFARLNKTERQVWHLHMRQLEPEAWKNLLDEGAIAHPKGTEAATIKLLDKPKFLKLYESGNKKITDALNKGRDLSDLMTDEKVAAGVLDPVTAAEAPYLAQRAVHGADFIGKKEADRTLPTKRLVATRNEVESMQKAYDDLAEQVRTGLTKEGKKSSVGGFTRDQQRMIAASGKLPAGPDIEAIVPKTLDEAKAYLDSLNQTLDDFMEKFAGGKPTPLDKAEQDMQRKINTNNGKYRNQQKGVTSSGRASGSSGFKRSLQDDINVAKRKEAEAYIYKIAMDHPELPAAQKFLALTRKIEELHSAIGEHAEHGLFGGVEGEVAPEASLGTKTITKPGPLEDPFPTPAGKMIVNGRILAPKGMSKLELHGAALSVRKTRLEQLERAYANRLAKLGGVKERGVVDRPGNSIPELAQRLADEGKMQPAYLHDESKVRRPLFSRAPGIGEAPKAGSSRQSLGILLRKGMINLHGDSLTGEFQRFARHISRSDVHAALLEHAAVVPESGLPAGWTHLLAKGESTPGFLEKNTGVTAAELAKETKQDLLNRFTTKDDHGDIAVDGEGHRLMIPDNVAKSLTFGASSERGLARSILLERPTSIWKHLVLGLRPAYMANILLSQHILGLLQAAPNGRGIYAYFNHLIPGARFGKLTDATVAEVLPEQAHGSFAASVGGASTKGLGPAKKLYEGVMPATLHVENWLRRLMIEGWAMAAPEIRAEMKANGGDLNAAMRSVKESNPHVLDEISQKVDHAQGNYRTYSPAEQKLRSVIPFYGWDRHIVQSTYRILAEHPFRALTAARLGQQGHAINERDFGALPTYLQDLVHINALEAIFGKSNGRATGISTKAIGPFTSDVDLAEALLSTQHGIAGTHTEEAGNINPLVSGIYEQLTGRSLLTGAPLKDKLPYGAWNIPTRVALQTPQARLLESYLGIYPLGKPKHPPASQVSGRLQLAGYLGAPVKRLDLAHEHLIAGLQGRPPR